MLAGIDHGFDGKRHSLEKFQSGARSAVMQYLWLLVKLVAYAVATVIAHHRVVVGFRMSLYGMTYITQAYPRSHQLYTFVQAFLGYLYQALGMTGNGADTIHLAGVAIPTIFDNSDINIDNISGLKDLFVCGNAMADHLVY